MGAGNRRWRGEMVGDGKLELSLIGVCVTDMVRSEDGLVIQTLDA